MLAAAWPPGDLAERAASAVARRSCCLEQEVMAPRRRGASPKRTHQSAHPLRTLLRLKRQTVTPPDRAPPVVRRAGRRTVCRGRPCMRHRGRTRSLQIRTRSEGSVQTTRPRTYPATCRHGRDRDAAQRAAAKATDTPTTGASAALCPAACLPGKPAPARYARAQNAICGAASPRERPSASDRSDLPHSLLCWRAPLQLSGAHLHRVEPCLVKLTQMHRTGDYSTDLPCYNYSIRFSRATARSRERVA